MHNQPLQLWGGIECTINRVGDEYFDQLAYSGHYDRAVDDINNFAGLGFTSFRYPVLWEKHAPLKGDNPNFLGTDTSLELLREKGIAPIVGLVHHGSGPQHISFLDGSFEKGLEEYATSVAERFPWVEYYTPVNEPLTTARFCGLYGHWFPHGKDDNTFASILLSECKGTIMAMRAIRQINPAAKLVLTEDLGKTYSSYKLNYQASFENARRWLSIDLISGLLTPGMPMWNYLLKSGIPESELEWFIDNGIAPDILGFNHYLTSERYLDDAIEHYPVHTHGSNGRHKYADVEAVRVPVKAITGPYVLLKEAWERYGMPLAITEVHLHCTREEQLRWFAEMWAVASGLKADGVNIQAVTAWALLGSFGWNNLLTKPNGLYEPGVFNISGGALRYTGLAHYLKRLSHNIDAHPLLSSEGWWKADSRLLYPGLVTNPKPRQHKEEAKPLLILGKTGTLGNGFSRICTDRGIHHYLLSRQDVDITNGENIRRVIEQYKPWGIINATGFVRVDDAALQFDQCYSSNCIGPQHLAKECKQHNIQLVNFSSDLVFNGAKQAPYTEADPVAPLNMYGKSKAMMEAMVLNVYPESLIIRTSAFFGPWDRYNFVSIVLEHLREGRTFAAASDIIISPTYVPDLVNATLDLLMDEASGIWHLCNEGSMTWAELARKVAAIAGYDISAINAVPHDSFGWPAMRPLYSAMDTTKGTRLPTLENAIERYFEEISTSTVEQEVLAIAA